MFSAVPKMDENLSHGDMMKISNNLTYNRNETISASISSGVDVFKGLMNGNLPVAVKRIQRVDIQTKNIQTFRKDCIERILEHPNIIRYFQCEINADFL